MTTPDENKTQNKIPPFDETFTAEEQIKTLWQSYDWKYIGFLAFTLLFGIIGTVWFVGYIMGTNFGLSLLK